MSRMELESGMQQTVFIVDDDPAILDGLSNLLESIGIRAQTFASAEIFRERWNPELPGCLLLDAQLPGIGGVEFQEQLRQAGIDLPIVFMTAHGDMPMVRKVMRAGAIEFLIKPFRKEELLQGIQEAFALDRSRREKRGRLGEIHARIDSLSPREREVMAMVTAGLLNKQIAAELKISEIMVKTHRRNMLDKMRAGSVAELVKMCESVKGSPRMNPPAAKDPLR